MNKKIKIIIIIIFSVLFLIFAFFFIGRPQPAEEITWGIIFSDKYSRELGLDWQENYLAILNDLKIKHLKVVAYWDLMEKEKDDYNFENLDWQIKEAEKKDVQLILVVGQRVPRWPECHIPQWAKDLENKEREEELLEFIEIIVRRYKDSPALQYWQVENEPFFSFGECPEFREDFLKEEVALVRQLDRRKIIVSESGEFPLWFKAAQVGDIVGHTLYRKVWVAELSIYFNYPFPPVFYNRKSWLIEKIFDKKTICVELQAEPWGPELCYNISLEEQKKTMDLEQLQKNISYAKRTGLDTFYLWGSEWWYWLKKEKGESQIWQEIKKLFI